MTSTSGEWGPNLYRHLEAHWRATGTNQNAWCIDHKIQPSTVSRWGSGGQPRLEAMQVVADALGVTMLDVLLIAGVLDKRDAGRAAAPAATIAPPEVAIREDPTLSDWQRKHVLDFLASLRNVVADAEAERGKSPAGTGRKSRSR